MAVCQQAGPAANVNPIVLQWASRSHHDRYSHHKSVAASIGIDMASCRVSSRAASGKMCWMRLNTAIKRGARLRWVKSGQVKSSKLLNISVRRHKLPPLTQVTRVPPGPFPFYNSHRLCIPKDLVRDTRALPGSSGPKLTFIACSVRARLGAAVQFLPYPGPHHIPGPGPARRTCKAERLYERHVCISI